MAGSELKIENTELKRHSAYIYTMQRIGYLCGSESWGGLEMNQWRNARWMRDRGHEVTVFGRLGSQLQQYCEQDNLRFVVIQSHKKYYDFSAGRTLSRLLKTYNIQHLIIRDVRDMSVSALAKYWGKHPFQLHYFMEMQLGVSKKNLLHTLRFRQLDTWSCPLHWLAEQVKTLTRMPQDRIVVIPSGLERAPLLQAPDKTASRKLLELPENGILIGLAGRFDPQKGQLLLLEAIQQLHRNDVGIVLLGAPTHGEGEQYHASMLKLIAAAGLEDRVFVRPFRNDIGVFYKAIDAFVMASKAETFGMVTIESMACGTPVIGSNAGGTPELLQFGKLGYLFEPLSPGDLARALETFLQESGRFSANTLQNAMELFDHQRVCEAIENHFNRKK